MSEKQETVADIVAELRQDYKGRPPINRAETTWCRRQIADRIEAAYKRDIEAYDLINFMSPVGRAEPAPVGNDAKMREVLEQIASIPMPPPIHLAQQCAREMREKAIAALAAPRRNCDRPECATTKAAQNVWRKEDGGKTAYYEWLLALATEGGEK